MYTAQPVLNPVGAKDIGRLGRDWSASRWVHGMRFCWVAFEKRAHGFRVSGCKV